MANTHSLDLERGSSQYAFVADTAPLSITGNLSIEAWVRLESLPSVGGEAYCIAAKMDQDGTNASYNFCIATNDKMRFFTSDDGNLVANGDANTALSINTSYHLGVTYSTAGSCTFYLNKVPDGNPSGLDTSISNNTSRFTIGAVDTQSTARFFMDGLVDEVAVYNAIVALDTLDNQADKTGRTNMVGYWKLNNDYVDVVNAANLTAVGSPVFSTTVPFVDYRGVFSGLQSKIW